MFQSFQAHYTLTKCHRQADVKLKELLDRLIVGEITENDNNILKSRFSNNVNFEELKGFQDVIRLFLTKEAVSFNLEKQQSMKDSNGNLVPIARVPAKHHGM